MSALDDIAAEGAALAASTAPAAASPGAPVTAAPGAEATDLIEAQSWAELPATFGGIVCMAMPELAPFYAPEKCLEWGKKMVPVAKRHGWSMEKFGPYLGLTVASATMVIPTVAAVKIRRAQAKKAPDNSTGTVTGGPGAATDSKAPAG